MNAESLAKLITVADVRRAAYRHLPRMIFDYVDGGAEDEVTLGRNVAAFNDVLFRPRAFVDVSDRDLGTIVLGQSISLPLMFAPTGLAALTAPGGDLDIARAAERCNTLYALSTASSYSIEDVAAAGSAPLWFQLYLWKSREVISSFISRASESGYQALCVTADVPMVGQRERDLRNGMTIPPRIGVRNVLDAGRHGAWVKGFLRGPDITFGNLVGTEWAEGHADATTLGSFAGEMLDASATWEGLRWIREEWSGPLVVKGIMTAEDARRAVDFGADGIIVSNHGGRQLDSLPGAIEVLPEVAEAVGDEAEVYLDGGIRRGSDVMKAVALGARACFVGRPYLYGLAIGGADGAARVVEILRGEMDRTLGLLGRRSLADLDAGAVRLAGSR